MKCTSAILTHSNSIYCKFATRKRKNYHWVRGKFMRTALADCTKTDDNSLTWVAPVILIVVFIGLAIVVWKEREDFQKKLEASPIVTVTALGTQSLCVRKLAQLSLESYPHAPVRALDLDRWSDTCGELRGSQEDSRLQLDALRAQK
jgi:hypothetical protein